MHVITRKTLAAEVVIFARLIKESLAFAFQSVVVNKVRTGLSLLGITIGIFAIISVFTMIDSLENNIRESINSLGNNVVYLQKWPWSFESDYAWWDYWQRPVPKYEEYELIKRKSNTVASVVFSASTRRQVKYADKTMDAVLWANTHEFPDIRAFEIETGRYFSPFESMSGQPVCVIGNILAKDLFGEVNPTGREIRISGRKVKVVGTTVKEGKGVIGDESIDNLILLPIAFAKTLFDIKSNDLNPFIMVKAREGIGVEQMKDDLREIMRGQRRLKPLEKDDFALNEISIISKGFDGIFAMINLVGWIIGGFSILVGGFGIANIMFVSVRERTTQIGIQKALGAKNYFILVQFLSESVLLAVVGGVIGLIMVFLATLGVQYGLDFNITMTTGNIITGILISSIIGIISGFVPAWKASRLNPVEAMNSTF